MKIERDSIEWNIFRDVFKLYEDYNEPRDGDDDYWISLVDAVNEFVKNHENHILAQRLAWAVAETFNDIVKERK